MNQFAPPIVKTSKSAHRTLNVPSATIAGTLLQTTSKMVLWSASRCTQQKSAPSLGGDTLTPKQLLRQRQHSKIMKGMENTASQAWHTTPPRILPSARLSSLIRPRRVKKGSFSTVNFSMHLTNVTLRIQTRSASWDLTSIQKTRWITSQRTTKDILWKPIVSAQWLM